MHAEGPAVGSGAVPALKPDSTTTTAAPKDTLENAPPRSGGSPGEPEPAEHIENASTPPEEKPSEALVPTGLGKPADSPKLTPPVATPPKASAPKVSAPKAGVRTIARGLRAGGTRTLARTPSTRRHGELPKRPHVSSVHDTFTEADRVSAELERTERFVGRAQKSILLSKNTRAIKLFTSALDFQSDSREAYKVRQFARAERLTLASRDFADRASRMVGPPREDPDYVDHVLRRTDDALERAKDVLKTGAGRDAWSQHEALRQEQKDAWKVFKGGDVGTAYKQTLAVREGVLALLRQLQDLPVPRETAEKAIGGAEQALEQANKELGPRPTLEAMRLVKLANEYLAKARQSFSRGSYRSALLQAKVVERHVEHAVDVGRPGSG